jgi:uncharacterized protein
MIFKLFTLTLVGFLIYIIFFKKNRENKIDENDDEIIDTMMECPKCKTYVSKQDTIISNGKYYCSQECLG